MKINKCTITIYPRYHWTPLGNVQEKIRGISPIFSDFDLKGCREIKSMQIRYVWNFCGLELSRKDVYHIPESMLFRSYKIKNDGLSIDLRPKKRKVYKSVKRKN